MAESLRPDNATPPKRGRPARLSADAIVDAALERLVGHALDDITFPSVARALGVSTMSLYSYFPQRDALLEAMTDKAFSQLELPARGGPWRVFLRDWLWAVKRHFDRQPAVSKALGWNGKVPAAWLRVSVPVIDELHAQGLDGKALLMAANWFMSSAIGLMLAEAIAPAYRQPRSMVAAEQLSAAEQASLRRMRHAWSPADRERLLALGFEKLLDSLGDLLTPSGKQQLTHPKAPLRASRRTR